MVPQSAIDRLRDFLFEKRFLNIKRSRNRLRLMLLLLILSVLLPIVILLKQAYRQLEVESYYAQKNNADLLFQQIDQRAAEILKFEDERPKEDYSFEIENETAGVRFSRLSPLALARPNTPSPAVIGYFQIDPSGAITTPQIPMKSENRARFAAAEMEARIQNFNFIKHILLQNRLLAQTNFIAPQSTSRSDPSLNTLFDDTLFKNYTFKKESFARNNPLAGTKISELQFEFEDGGGDVFQNRSAPEKRTDRRSSKWSDKRNKERMGIKLSEPSSITSLFRPLKLTPPKSALDLMGDKAQEATLDSQYQPSILSFDGAVDPHQFAILPTGEGVFYRRVWQKEQPFIQGFLVDMNGFIKALFENQFARSQISKKINLLIAYKGLIITRMVHLETKNRDGNKEVQVSKMGPQTLLKSEIPLLRASLSAPLNQFELLLTATELPATPGRTLINILALMVFLVLGFGLYLIYRLALGQLEFAKQRSDFVSAISHELKTPLTSIRMYGEMLRDGWVYDEVKKKSYYDFIYFESERLSRLINNVLYLARYTNEENRQQLTAHHPHELLARLEMKIRPSVEAAGYKLEVVVKDFARERSDDLLIMADEDAMSQIALNLTDNAIKFSKSSENKTVQLGLQILGDPAEKVVFLFRDFGPGVPKNQREKIFQLFYRAEDEMTRTTAGTGIGLALVRQLTESMKANVKLRNVNPGAEFRIEFRPLRSPPMEADTQPTDVNL